MSNEITAIISIPTSPFTNNVVFLTPDSLKKADGISGISTIASGFTVSSDHYRWAWAINQVTDKIYFTNPDNTLRSTDGYTLDTMPSGLPGGKYLEIFFDHLMVGHVYEGGNISPYKVRWSDIYDFEQFTPTTGNEADSYEFNEPEVESGYGRGLTGMKRLGQGLAVYTPNTIYMVQYVGLPDVMRIDTVVTGLGNVFPYALASVNRLHYFISNDNFYAFDGVSDPQPIGDSVKDYFFADVNVEQEIRDQTWCYINRQTQEIWWVYVSNASTTKVMDKAVVFNYRENLWYPATVENVHSFGYLGTLYRPIDELTALSTTIDGLTGEINRLGITDKTYLYAWGGAGRLMQEEVSTDPDADLLSQTTPFLETGDLTYGSLQHVKEVDSMVIHAEYEGAYGIQLEYSVRDDLNDAVTWTVAPELWTSDLPEKRLSFPRISGRVFRYRFKPVMTSTGLPTLVLRSWKMLAWVENVYGANFTVEK